MYELYLITNNQTGHMYVGQTSLTIEARWKKHVYDAESGRQSYFWNAVRKYGKDSFIHQSLTNASTRQDANNLERLWIVSLRTYDDCVGYNSTFGGEGCYHTPEIGRKISRSKIGVARPPLVRKKLSEANIKIRIPEDTVIALYKQGLSLAQLSAYFLVSKRIVKRTLTGAGVVLRSRGWTKGTRHTAESIKRMSDQWYETRGLEDARVPVILV